MIWLNASFPRKAKPYLRIRSAGMPFASRADAFVSSESLFHDMSLLQDKHPVAEGDVGQSAGDQSLLFQAHISPSPRISIYKEK